MATQAAYDAVKTYLSTTFSPTSVVDYDEIDTVIEQQNVSFFCLQEINSIEDFLAFGDPSALCVREISSFIVHVLVPAPESASVARQLAEQVQTGLRFRILDSVTVSEVAPPEPGILNDGLWTSYQVTILTAVDRHVARP